MESSALPLKHLYMGINIEACNRNLPVSSFVSWIRRKSGNHKRSKSVNLPQLSKGSIWRRFGARVWATGRLANQLAEEWYRQALAWSYKRRGNVVLYDRHFLFDFSLDGIDTDENSVERRVHRWVLTRFYPQPDLVIYLDAPGELLFARKQEKSVEELEKRRQAFLRQARIYKNFVLIDAAQPLPKVFADVTKTLIGYCNSTRTGIALKYDKKESFPPNSEALGTQSGSRSL